MSEKMGSANDAENEVRVGIVGGGIAGLYCAWRLARSQRPRFNITLLEGLPRLGGRIETVRMDRFNAEFGPMRFEPEEVQPAFHELCKDLKIDLVAFGGPVGSVAPSASRPHLFFQDEAATGGDAKALLRLGILKLLGQTPTPSEIYRSAHGEVTGDDDWIESQTDYELFQAHQIGGRPLYEFGFWNALARVLSHQAVDIIRNRGTFYHFILENPNALEWAIFWLRALQAPDGYFTIPDGVSTLTTKLEAQLGRRGNLAVKKEHVVQGIETRGDGVEIRYRSPTGRGSDFFDHVILALPQSALCQLSGLPRTVAKHAKESVAGVPMIKVFQAAKPSPWVEFKWDQWRRTNQLDESARLAVRRGQVPFISQAHELTVPTRESHIYFRVEDGHCMRMFYMDRPATAFWDLLIANPKDHWSADLYEDVQGTVNRDAPGSPNVLPCGASLELHDAVTRCVRAWEAFQLAEDGLRDVDRHLARNRDYGVEPDPLRMPETVAIGIRDWGAPPVGGAAHVWRPGVRSWEVRRALKSFSLAGKSSKSNVHICGEAYSDAQGFIEGALTSATDVLKEMGCL